MKRWLGMGYVLIGVSPLMAAEVTPVMSWQFLGGQHFFGGETSSLSGNFDLNYTPVVRFSETWSLVPTYSGNYQGTRDVRDLAGGGTSFQDSTGHGVLLKSVHRLGFWKLKPSIAARVDLLREVDSEDWGDGLFDHTKIAGGLEAEYNRSKTGGGRLAYDYYQLTFPNYTSLESATSSATLTRELAGEKVLDSKNHLVTLGGWSSIWGGARLDVNAYLNKRDFDDQPLVVSNGDLSATKRSDTTVSVTAQSGWKFDLGESVRAVSDWTLGWSQQTSNQNHFDAQKAVFIPNFYDYSEWTLAPRLMAAFGQSKWVGSLGMSYQQRSYTDRPTQSGTGDYLGEGLNVTLLSTQVGASRPLSEKLKLRFLINMGWGDSNTEYNGTFLYHYRLVSYLMGLSYEL